MVTRDDHEPDAIVAARESRALEWSAGAAALAIAWIALPVAAGLLLGTLMAFSLRPLHEAIERRARSPAAASFATVLVTAAVILCSVGGSLSRGVVLTRIAARGPQTERRAERLPGILRDSSPAWVSGDELTSRLRDAAAAIASRAATFAEAAASATASGLLALFLRGTWMRGTPLGYVRGGDNHEHANPHPDKERADVHRGQRASDSRITCSGHTSSAPITACRRS
jgi:hypothetical protein